MNAADLFNPNGNINHPIDVYFDEDNDGFMKPEICEYVDQNYYKFKPTSDIVWLYYAEKYASETKGHYSTKILFIRSR